MDNKPQPVALKLAEMLPANEWLGHVTLVSYARECVAELLRQHAENETLRVGYAAARLEIESLKAQLHAAKQINAAPADSGVQEDAAWMPLTPELLTAIESGDLGNRFWIAAHNSNEPQIGVYEWQQGRNPHGFNSDLSRYGASEITHVLPYKPPALPAASSPQSKEKSNDR